jgi:hypothetical protein
MRLYKTPPLVEFLRSSSNGDTLKLRRNMTYYIGHKTITVPKGFTCDGMSVPRMFWGLVSPTIHPSTIAASMLHDYLYRTHAFGWPRKQADVLFYVLLRSDGFPRWRALLAYIGVRLFGGRAWKEGVCKQ